jgi:hypothetical protein
MEMNSIYLLQIVEDTILRRWRMRDGIIGNVDWIGLDVVFDTGFGNLF